MTRRRWLAGIGLAVLVAAAAGLGWSWHRSRAEAAEAQRLAGGQRLVAAGSWAEAAALARASDPGSRLAAAWRRLDAQASAGLRDLPRLQLLAGLDPASIQGPVVEPLAARALLAAGEVAACRSLIGDRAGSDPAWFAVALDLAIHQGDRQALLGLAQAAAGDARLARVLIHRQALQAADPRSALDVLARAVRRDPGDAEAYGLAGLLHARAGNHPAALAAWQAAVERDPLQPLWRDGLARTRLAQGAFAAACAAWAGAARSGYPAEVALALRFWHRVAAPGRVPQAQAETAAISPLLVFLDALPPDRFFDEQAWSRCRAGDHRLDGRAEVHWLRLLEALRQGQSAASVPLVATTIGELRNPSPLLADALAVACGLREVIPDPGVDGHAAARQLAAGGEAATAVREALRGPQGPALACLLAGWERAAVLLAPGEVPTSWPAWAAYGLARSRLDCGDAPGAFAALRGRSADRPCALLAAELAAGAGEAEALRWLTALSRGDDAVAQRATWLLGTVGGRP